MATKIEDYLHLYLMCGVLVPRTDMSEQGDTVDLGLLTGVNNGGYEAEVQLIIDGNASEDPTLFKPEEVKLILRRLASMTADEKKEYAQRKQRKGYMPMVHAENTTWLLSLHFDLFGLIDAGLAIDRKTI